MAISHEYQRRFHNILNISDVKISFPKLKRYPPVETKKISRAKWEIWVIFDHGAVFAWWCSRVSRNLVVHDSSGSNPFNLSPKKGRSHEVRIGVLRC